MTHPGRPTISYRVEVRLTLEGPWRLADYVYGTYRQAVRRARDASPEQFRIFDGRTLVAHAKRNGGRYSWIKGGWQWRAN